MEALVDVGAASVLGVVEASSLGLGGGVGVRVKKVYKLPNSTLENVQEKLETIHKSTP